MKPLFVRELSDPERQALQAGLRSSDGFTGRRYHILLASARGDTTTVIAQAVGCSPQAVRNVLRAFETRGLAVVAPQSRRPHTAAKLLDAERSERLKALLPQSPRQFGRARSTWTLALGPWPPRSAPSPGSRPSGSVMRPSATRSSGWGSAGGGPRPGSPARTRSMRSKKLGRQNWLACPLLQCGQIGVRVTTEAGPQGPGVAPAVETLAECGPSLPANPTQFAHSRWAQPRRRGRDQAHLPTQHGGRGGRFAPIGPELVVALRAEQMLEVVVGPRQAGQRVTMEQPGFVAAGHLAEVLDGVRERPRLAGVPVHGGDQPVEAAPDKVGVLLAPVVQDVRGPVHPAVGARCPARAQPCS